MREFRKFNGKRYSHDGGFNQRFRANSRKKSLKQRGYCVRVVEVHSPRTAVFQLYKRKK